MTFSNPIQVTPNRVLEMTKAHEPEEIAEILNIHVDLVMSMLAKAGARGKWLLVCAKTNRRWNCFSERGAYMKAQVLGLTDYTFGRTAS